MNYRLEKKGREFYIYRGKDAAWPKFYANDNPIAVCLNFGDGMVHTASGAGFLSFLLSAPFALFKKRERIL